MKLNKKIWVKKTHTDNGSYFQIYLRDYLALKKTYQLAVDNEKTKMPYERAPVGYSTYRYIKANYIRGLFWLIGIALLISVVILFKHNIASIKNEIEKLRR